jgi:hypothetical protein
MGKDDLKCLIKVSGVSVDVSERSGSEPICFEEFSFAIFRDGLPETFQQSRWISYVSATSRSEDVEEGPVKMLAWKTFNDAFFAVDFRVAEVASASSVNSTTGPMTRVHRKTNHQIRLSVCARSLSSGKSSTFSCPTGIDPSEAFNYPAGSQQYSFQVKSSDPTRSFPPGSGGVPKTIRCTVVALREQSPVPPLRSFHEQCILVDQFVLSCGETSMRKGTVSYGFGFLTDISEGSAAKNLTRYTQDLLPPVQSDDGNASVDFSQLQNAKALDALERNPVEFCIVSVDSKTYNNVTIGNRIISTSRFKTGEKGLAKASLKAQLVLCLIRSDAAGNRSLEVNEDASLDLAGEVLNMETIPDDGIVRKTVFSYGETLYCRIRRRCFVDAAVHGDKLLSTEGVALSPTRASAVGDSTTGGTTSVPLPPPAPLRKEEHEEPAPRPLYSPTV